MDSENQRKYCFEEFEENDHVHANIFFFNETKILSKLST